MRKLFLILFIAFPLFAQNTNSISFDGGDYLAYNSDYMTSQGQGTISFWIKPADTDNFDTIIGQRKTTSANFFYRIRFYQNYIEVDSRNNDTETAIQGNTTTITTGVWHHVTVVCSTKTQIWVDGIKQNMNLRGGADDGEWFGDVLTTDQLIIGSSTTTAQFYNGIIDELNIWSTPLTDEQVSLIYNNGTPKDESSLSPNDYWAFNEGTGTTTINSDADITLTFGATTAAPSWSTDTPGWDAGDTEKYKGFKERQSRKTRLQRIPTRRN